MSVSAVFDQNSVSTTWRQRQSALGAASQTARALQAAARLHKPNKWIATVILFICW